MKIYFLFEVERNSYAVAAQIYRRAFESAGHEVMESLYPATADACLQLVPELQEAVVIHFTIGPLFRPIPGARNIAVVFHEWDHYPSGWAGMLDHFDQIWAPSAHVKKTLERSGVHTPIHTVPLPLNTEPIPEKQSWNTSRPFRFLSVGEPHFRKGFHLLMAGFCEAFPEVGEAELMIKTSDVCRWRGMREDIRVLAGSMSRQNLLALYHGSDAFVTASLGEGLGLPLAEAIVSLLPVAANYWGGHRDLLRKGSFWDIVHQQVIQPYCSEPSYYAAGQRCAYSSPENIASTLRELVSASNEQRKERARMARAFLLTRFTQDRSAKKVQRALSLIFERQKQAGLYSTQS